MKLSNLQKALMVYRAYPRPMNSLELQTLYREVHTGEHGFIERRSIDLRQRGLIERVGKPRTKRVQYVINEFGASLDITKLDQLPVVRRDEKKVRVSREDSEVKKECKEIDKCNNCNGKGYNTVYKGEGGYDDFGGGYIETQKMGIHKIICSVCKGEKTKVKEGDVINVEMKNGKITKTEVKEKQPPIQPTTLGGKIMFYFMRLFGGEK